MERVAAEQWQAILELLRKDLTTSQFETWFDTAKVKSAGVDGRVLRLNVPNRYFKAVLSENYREQILKAAQAVTGGEGLTLEIAVSGDLYRALREGQEKEGAQPAAMERQAAAHPRPMMLNPLFAWEDFVSGSGNRLAYSALGTVTESPGGIYNPVFIHGSHGLGKTHLLQGVAGEIKRRHPGFNVAYMPSETFVNEYVAAVPTKMLPTFRRRMRSVDVLLVDDFHFLAGKEKTQQEFQHTFDALQSQGKQMIISALMAPGEMGSISDAVASRLMSGLVIRLESPGPDLRMDIIRRKAGRIRTEMPESVVAYLAGQMGGSVREIEGAVAKVCAYSISEGRAPDVPMARRALSELQSMRPGPVSLEEICATVSEHFHLEAATLKGRCRTRSTAIPRHVAMYIAKELNGYSLTEIGRFFGGRNHSTVLYATARIAADLAENKQLKHIITKIRASLGR